MIIVVYNVNAPYDVSVINLEVPMLISLNEWCKIRRVSRQWACRLCSDGRIDGAVFVGNYRWEVPEDAVVPERKLSPRIAESMRRVATRNAKRAEYEHAEAAASRGRLIIREYVEDGLFIDASGHVFRCVEGKIVERAAADMVPWGDREQAEYFACGGKRAP